MRVVLSKEEGIILVNEITLQHIVVGITSFGSPVILTREELDEGYFYFSALYKEGVGCEIITNGNRYTYGLNRNMHELIKRHLDAGGKLAAFHKEEWKKAFQWLINNVDHKYSLSPTDEKSNSIKR